MEQLGSEAGIQKACRWLLLACVPVSMLAVGEYLPAAVLPNYPTYLKYFTCQTLAALVAVLGAAWWMGRRHAPGTQRTPPPLLLAFWIALAAYAAWSAASCLWAAWPYGARGYLVRELTFYFLCFAACALLAEPRRWVSFARLFTAAALIAALWQGAYLVLAYLKAGGQRPLWLLFYERPFLYGNMNSACAPCICGALLVVGFALGRLRRGSAEAPVTRGRIPRGLLLAGCAAAVGAFAFMIVAARSLAGYVALLVAVIAYALCMLPIRRRSLVAGVLAGAVLLGMLALLNVPSWRRQAINKLAGTESTAQARLLWWLAATDMLWEKPIAGWGVGAYGSAYYRFAPPLAEESYYTAGKQAEHPHNELLRVGAELGTVGLVLYMAVLAAALVASCRALRRQEFRLRAIGYALWAGALGYVVQATLGKEAMTWDFALPYWLLLGLLASAAGWRAPGDAPARVPWRMTGLRGLACGVAILAVAWLWWDWAVGGYRSMVYMRDALGYLGAAERRLLKLQKEGLPPDAGVERGIERGGAFLDLARARSLWPTDVVVGHYVLGALIADVGRCRQSLGHLQWVERAAPGAFNVEYLLGRCHRALGHIAKARVYLTRSIERHPTLTAAYAELAALDAQHAATALLQQVLRERFADPGRAALMGRLMASIELWDAVARLLEDTQRAGESESLRALGAALEDFCREAGRGDRLEALRRRFPAAFAVPPSQGRSLPL